jgi:2'-5' RNA ligase
MATDPAPLILTLALDPATQAHFDALRQRHFPPAINYLAAHVTLFHHLPGAERAAIAAELTRRARQLPPLPVLVTGLRFLGRGVAFTLENPTLRQLHKELQTTWHAWLTPQDQQKLSPHITVQNKVAPAPARQLLAELTATFQPTQITGTGLRLWAYRGGPWELLQHFPFTG